MSLRPYPVQSRASDLSCRPFFIVTAGRSGSTLLRAIINQDPTVIVPPESHVLGQLTRKFKRCFRFLPWEYVVRLVISEFEMQDPGFSFWKLDMQKFYPRALALPRRQRSLAKLVDMVYVYYLEDKKPEASRWGDKSIRNALYLPQIDSLFPDARYVVLIRDGRDVALSLVKADTTTVTDVERAADYWLRSVTKARRFAQRLDPSRHLEIFYEDLVSEPEPVVRRLYEFLDLEFGPEALEFAGNVDSLGDANRQIHRNLKKPISTASVGKWRRELSEEKRSAVEALLRDELLELDYAVD